MAGVGVAGGVEDHGGGVGNELDQSAIGAARRWGITASGSSASICAHQVSRAPSVARQGITPRARRPPNGLTSASVPLAIVLGRDNADSAQLSWACSALIAGHIEATTRSGQSAGTSPVARWRA